MFRKQDRVVTQSVTKMGVKFVTIHQLVLAGIYALAITTSLKIMNMGLLLWPHTPGKSLIAASIGSLGLGCIFFIISGFLAARHLFEWAKAVDEVKDEVMIIGQRNNVGINSTFNLVRNFAICGVPCYFIGLGLLVLALAGFESFSNVLGYVRAMF